MLFRLEQAEENKFLQCLILTRPVTRVGDLREDAYTPTFSGHDPGQCTLGYKLKISIIVATERFTELERS
jgi:hypothetical protein